jgi:hypothetical protein
MSTDKFMKIDLSVRPFVCWDRRKNLNELAPMQFEPVEGCIYPHTPALRPPDIPSGFSCSLISTTLAPCLPKPNSEQINLLFASLEFPSVY